MTSPVPLDLPPAAMIVGLGNPGRRYRDTRHNVGFQVLDHLVRLHGGNLDRRGWAAHYGRGRIAERTVVLVKPLAYMNRSGPPVRCIATAAGLTAERIVVVHDDLDLAPGRLKIKRKGGSGGHRGLRSLMESIGSRDFTRVRVGIGRPSGAVSVVDYVLEKIPAAQQQWWGEIVAAAAGAVATIVACGVQTAMERCNLRRTETCS